MTMCGWFVAASAFCVGLVTVPVAAADRDLPTVVAAQSSLATAAASADMADTPNCLLPGQIRNFGGITMVTPRRAIATDAADCAARGGTLIENTAAAID